MGIDDESRLIEPDGRSYRIQLSEKTHVVLWKRRMVARGSLDFFFLAHEPVRGPNSMKAPSEVLQLLLPQPITISTGRSLRGKRTKNGN
jgi:hypothetical protein